MNFKEIKTGVVFTIGETPSYPKLKTDSGYVDMRDEIINNNPNQAVLSADCRELTIDEIAKIFDVPDMKIKEWIKEKKSKFISSPQNII